MCKMLISKNKMICHWLRLVKQSNSYMIWGDSNGGDLIGLDKKFLGYWQFLKVGREWWQL